MRKIPQLCSPACRVFEPEPDLSCIFATIISVIVHIITCISCSESGLGESKVCVPVAAAGPFVTAHVAAAAAGVDVVHIVSWIWHCCANSCPEAFDNPWVDQHNTYPAWPALEVSCHWLPRSFRTTHRSIDSRLNP